MLQFLLPSDLTTLTHVVQVLPEVARRTKPQFTTVVILIGFLYFLISLLHSLLVLLKILSQINLHSIQVSGTIFEKTLI